MSNARRSGRDRQNKAQPVAEPIQSPRPDAASKRRERKRATDRLAQQEHRKRQKQYIEELEAKVDFMMSNSDPDKAAILMRQNQVLREELQKLKGFVEALQLLLKNFSPNQDQNPTNMNDSVANTANDSASSADSLTPERSSSATVDLHDLSSSHVAVDLIEYETTEDDLNNLIQAEPLQGMNCERNLDPSNTSDSITFDETHQLTADLAGGSITERLRNQRQSQRHLSAFFQLPNLDTARHPAAVLPEHIDSAYWPAWPTLNSSPWSNEATDAIWPNYSSLHPPTYPVYDFQELGKVPFPYGPQNWILRHGAWDQSNWTANCPTVLDLPVARPLYLCLPLLSNFVPATDAHLLKFLQLSEAEETRSTRKPIPHPTVIDYLIDNQTNPLSLKIKSYLAPVAKVMKTTEILASYWIISLFSRWYINKDHESFEAVPVWLRPTTLQRTIDHPLNLWFMPWPSLRDAAISQAIVNPECSSDIMQTLGLNLEVDLTGQSALKQRNKSNAAAHTQQDDAELLHASRVGETSSSNEDPDSVSYSPENVDKAIRDLRNWKLRDGFFDRYPAWKALYLDNVTNFT